MSEKLSPIEMSRQVASAHLIAQDRSGCIYEFLDDKGVWEPRSKKELEAYTRQLELHAEHSNPTRRRDIVDNWLTFPGNDLGDGSTQVGIIKWNDLADDEVAFKDGIYSINNDTARWVRPDDWLDRCLPYSMDPKAQCPKWLAFLEDTFSDDPYGQDKITCLQEFAGYALLPHANYKKAMFLYGQSNTGKSVIEQVFRALVGEENHCSIKVDDMDDPRKLASIKGKMLNSITEVSESAMIADGGFKQLVSAGDAITIDPKYQAPFTYTPSCVHLVCTNNLPDVNDASEATYNRFLLVRMGKVVPKVAQNPFLVQDLVKELQGIANWALLGAYKLNQQRGQFTEPGDQETQIEQLHIDNNPVAELLDIHYDRTITEEVGPLERVQFIEFYDKFNEWKGGKPWSKRIVGKKLSAMGIQRVKSNGQLYLEGIKKKLSSWN